MSVFVDVHSLILPFFLVFIGVSEEGRRVQCEFNCPQGEVRGSLQGDGHCSESTTVETDSTTHHAGIFSCLIADIHVYILALPLKNKKY